jgi:hypothetical protein
MPRYLCCRARVGSDDGAAAIADDDADVDLGEGRILVSYFDDEGPVVLQGLETTPGRFELAARSRPRKAELALEGDRLEGRWWEARRAGSLRIELGEEET